MNPKGSSRNVRGARKRASRFENGYPHWERQGAVDWRETGIDEATLKHWYYLVLLGRRLDLRFQILNRQGRAPFTVSCAGHECAQVGVSWPLVPEIDWIFPYYRDVVVCLRMGLSPLDLMLSVLAKAPDPASGGRQTPGHFSSRKLKIVSTGSPVATQLVHGAGTAYAAKIDARPEVVLTTYGDGAGSEGDAHEALNFAGIHKLPQLFVCENNRLAISVPFGLQYPIEYVAQRAAGYGFPGITVDGSDPVTCYYVAEQAVSRARDGGGPSLIECLVDRLAPHTSDDDHSRYRTRQEIEQLAGRDCLARFRVQLLREGILSEKEMQECEAKVQSEIDEATELGLDAPDPVAASALDHVYGPCLEATIPRETPSSQDVNMVQAIRLGLAEEMGRDDSIVILGEDVGRMGGVFRATEGLLDRFGHDRVIETPVAESSIAGVSLGLAIAGKRPVAEIQFADFAHLAFNQITNEIAKLRYRSNGAWAAPLVIRAPMGGGVHGGLYHSQSIEARFATPGLKIVIPSSPYQAKGLLAAAVRDPNPILFLEHKRLYRMTREAVPVGSYVIPIGPARTARTGADISVICYGLMVHYALAAAAELERNGISVEVIDLRTVYPLDKGSIIGSVRRTGKVLVLYEDNLSVSIGSEVAAVIAEDAWDCLDAPIRRLGGLDVPAMPFASSLEHFFMPSVEKVIGELTRLAKF